MISEIETTTDPVLSREDAIAILNTPDEELDQLIAQAEKLRRKYKGNHVSIHILTNARSGNCSQDCAYCAQSCRSKADIDKYKWVADEKLYKDNDFVNEHHLSRHCIGLSGMKFTDEEIEELASKIRKMKEKWESEKESRQLTVDENDIADVISGWTKIPVSKLAEGETERLLKLESILHERVVGQDEAVVAVAKAIRRGRVGLKDPKRPIGSFLFLGPTGVGKTELCKALAEAMFGTENALIRVDMSEYMEKHSVSKMIGSPPGYVGYEGGGQLSEKVRRNPYSVILFDEVEKAHPDVFNILLQVLDDGHITDSQGHKIDFKNTVIIMTSNAGAENIIAPKQLGFMSQDDEKVRYQRMKTGVMDEVKRMFKPEFLNRIDDTIVFHPLTKDHMKEIVTILLNILEKRTKSQMTIRLNVGDDVKEYLVEKGYDEKYGARPLKRTIQNLIEDKLAELVLEGKVREGDSVKITCKDGELKFSARHPQTAGKTSASVVKS